MFSPMRVLTAALSGVIAIGLSGLGASVAFGKDVTLMVDGVPQDVNIVYGTVAEILADKGIAVTARDQVTPALDAIVTNDMMITVRHAKPIDLTLDGQTGVYWTFASTVDDALTNLGLGDSPMKLTATLDTVIPMDGLTLAVQTSHQVNVTAAGETTTLNAFGTVADALTAMSLTWDDDDIVTPDVTSPLGDNLEISLVKVDTQTVTRDITIPHETTNTNDPESPKGQVRVITAGADGTATQTVEQVLHDGGVVSETVTGTVVSKEPVTAVTSTGTQVPKIAVDPQSAQGIAYDMVRARGWDDAQFQCLVNLWDRESHWNVSSANTRSGAYGIPQALPGSKMASVGADWRTNPATQITWGLGYIAGRYKTPCGAWGHFQSSGWY